ncbi:hyaluronidase-1-like isoform X2 [Gracilinanus agilis]|uniref:hyaluronidase-1-like isoform X2 n=1 Tax=Gracilinanus agilis TaxID=191870 RepID=UPI001CFEADDA|nr:hyaluronidase-1-like isoform X2 [Gracilinanus agilis]
MAPGDFKPSICVLLLILVDLTRGSGGPVLPNIPFVVVWNANTYLCEENFQVNISLDAFHVVANPSQVFRGPNMTIFYRPDLGIYPWYTQAKQPINGGLPQNASLQGHLTKSSKDILATLPESDFHGIVVIDWEEWRPNWKTNWDSKKIYRNQSLALVREEHPDWSPSQVKEMAKKQFEEAAKEWMVETLKLGKLLRPRGLWGYYGFPDCYNYNFQEPNYTGECLPAIRHLNDKLSWLWEQSRALYPSIYLPLELEDTGKSLLFVRSRLQEAFRVARKSQNPDQPILPYAQIFYALTDVFLPWESCQNIKDYVDTTLGPFVLNVTSSAYICSEALCSGHGRCARRQHHPHAFLFLEDSFSIYQQPGSGHLRLQGFLEEKSLEKMKTQFECRCYTGWTGKHCDHLESQ